MPSICGLLFVVVSALTGIHVSLGHFGMATFDFLMALGLLKTYGILCLTDQRLSQLKAKLFKNQYEFLTGLFETVERTHRTHTESESKKPQDISNSIKNIF